MRLTGLIAAPYTPFDSDNRIAIETIGRQVEHLVQTGADGAFVCGTTGEGLSLSTTERQTVVAEWVTRARGRFPVIAHVGHPALVEAQSLARHAREHGVQAVAAVAPFYYRAATTADLVDFLAAIARSVPDLPFYYYDIPRITGVTLPTAELMERLAARAPNFAGVKYSNPDLIGFQECLAVRGGEFNVLFGFDEMLLAAWALGVRGAVGSTYNFAVPLYRKMIAAYHEGDHTGAAQRQLKSVQLVRLMEQFGGLASGKAIMAMLGVDCGPTRVPIRALKQDERVKLGHQLAEMGFFRPDFSGATESR